MFNGFGPSKTIEFPIVFSLIFMFFQNRSREPFLEGPGAELLWKVWFWCNFRFSGFSKRQHHFRPKGFQRRGASSWGERPCTTLLFTKPLWLLCHWDLLGFRRSFLGSRLTHVLFFLFSCVLFSLTCIVLAFCSKKPLQFSNIGSCSYLQNKSCRHT